MINVPVRVRLPPFPANFYENANSPLCLPRLLLARFAHLSRVKIQFSRGSVDSLWTLFALVTSRKNSSQRSRRIKKSAEYEIDRSERSLRIVATSGFVEPGLLSLSFHVSTVRTGKINRQLSPIHTVSTTTVARKPCREIRRRTRRDRRRTPLDTISTIWRSSRR